MSLDRATFLRYLRQRAELSGGDLFLEALSRDDALLLASGRGGSSSRFAPAHAEELSPSSVAVASPGRAEPRDWSGQLPVLREEVLACQNCRLSQGRSTVVFGEGNPSADLVVVGEAPGYEEDRTGRPFVGPAGKLLDLMLMTIGLARDEVFICNVLKCRPPNNRNPLQDEIEACSGYLRAQIDLIRPHALLAVGKFAAQTLASSEESIGRLRNRVHSYQGTPLIATYHPAFLLRSPQWIRAAWRDFQFLRQVLDEQV